MHTYSVHVHVCAALHTVSISPCTRYPTSLAGGKGCPLIPDPLGLAQTRQTGPGAGSLPGPPPVSASCRAAPRGESREDDHGRPLVSHHVQWPGGSMWSLQVGSCLTSWHCAPKDCACWKTCNLAFYRHTHSIPNMQYY